MHTRYNRASTTDKVARALLVATLAAGTGLTVSDTWNTAAASAAIVKLPASNLHHHTCYPAPPADVAVVFRLHMAGWSTMTGCSHKFVDPNKPLAIYQFSLS